MPPKKKKFDHAMIDLETLNTLSHGVILSIGAVRFNEDEIDDNAFYRVITLESNLAEHRSISADTLRWWMTQNENAKALFATPLREQVTLEQGLIDLREFLGTPLEAENTKVWGNGADFDIAMLAHAYGEQGTPWKFWNVRCFRTLKSTEAARQVPKPANALAHNALADALAQAQHLQLLWKAGIGK